MIVIIDGPEAVGKTSLIAALQDRYAPTTTAVRRWGPVSDWSAYINPLAEDLSSTLDIVFWDRSWAAEVVYNQLLERGRKINEKTLASTLELAVTFQRGHLLMLDADPAILTERRLRRIKEGGKPDLPCDPSQERNAFMKYAKDHQWVVVRDKNDVIKELENGYAEQA